MPRKQLYAFDREDAGILARMARAQSLHPQMGAFAAGDWEKAGRVGAWIMETTSELTACTYGEGTEADITPGEGTAKIKRLVSATADTLEDYIGSASTYVERDIKSLLHVPIPEGEIVLGMRTQDQQLWAVVWLSRKLGSFVAKTGAEAISPRTGNTPGEGYVDTYRLNLDSGDLEVYEENVHVYSWVSVESGTNNWVYVGYDVFGTLWFENEDCGNEY